MGIVDFLSELTGLSQPEPTKSASAPAPKEMYLGRVFEDEEPVDPYEGLKYLRPRPKTYNLSKLRKLLLENKK